MIQTGCGRTIYDHPVRPCRNLGVGSMLQVTSNWVSNWEVSQIMSAPRMPTRRLAIPRPSGGSVTILISSEETGGAMSMIETATPPGGGPFYHSHSREDETFYVVSGTAEVRIANETFLCKARDHVSGPRNVFHNYHNVGEDELKLILVYFPGGFEQSFLDLEAMVQDGKDASEIDRMLSERYGLTRG